MPLSYSYWWICKIDYKSWRKWKKMSMFLAGKPRNSKQSKGMCALNISPHSFIAVTLVDWCRLQSLNPQLRGPRRLRSGLLNFNATTKWTTKSFIGSFGSPGPSDLCHQDDQPRLVQVIQQHHLWRRRGVKSTSALAALVKSPNFWAVCPISTIKTLRDSLR